MPHTPGGSTLQQTNRETSVPHTPGGSTLQQTNPETSVPHTPGGSTFQWTNTETSPGGSTLQWINTETSVPHAPGGSALQWANKKNSLPQAPGGNTMQQTNRESSAPQAPRGCIEKRLFIPKIILGNATISALNDAIAKLCDHEPFYNSSEAVDSENVCIEDYEYLDALLAKLLILNQTGLALITHSIPESPIKKGIIGNINMITYTGPQNNGLLYLINSVDDQKQIKLWPVTKSVDVHTSEKGVERTKTIRRTLYPLMAVYLYVVQVGQMEYEINMVHDALMKTETQHMDKLAELLWQVQMFMFIKTKTKSLNSVCETSVEDQNDSYICEVCWNTFENMQGMEDHKNSQTCSSLFFKICLKYETNEGDVKGMKTLYADIEDSAYVNMLELDMKVESPVFLQVMTGATELDLLQTIESTRNSSATQVPYKQSVALTWINKTLVNQLLRARPVLQLRAIDANYEIDMTDFETCKPPKCVDEFSLLEHLTLKKDSRVMVYHCEDVCGGMLTKVATVGIISALQKGYVNGNLVDVLMLRRLNHDKKWFMIPRVKQTRVQSISGMFRKLCVRSQFPVCPAYAWIEYKYRLASPLRPVLHIDMSVITQQQLKTVCRQALKTFQTTDFGNKPFTWNLKACHNILRKQKHTNPSEDCSSLYNANPLKISDVCSVAEPSTKRYKRTHKHTYKHQRSFSPSLLNENNNPKQCLDPIVVRLTKPDSIIMGKRRRTKLATKTKSAMIHSNIVYLPGQTSTWSGTSTSNIVYLPGQTSTQSGTSISNIVWPSGENLNLTQSGTSTSNIVLQPGHNLTQSGMTYNTLWPPGYTLTQSGTNTSNTVWHPGESLTKSGTTTTSNTVLQPGHTLTQSDAGTTLVTWSHSHNVRPHMSQLMMVQSDSNALAPHTDSNIIVVQSSPNRHVGESQPGAEMVNRPIPTGGDNGTGQYAVAMTGMTAAASDMAAAAAGMAAAAPGMAAAASGIAQAFLVYVYNMNK